MEQTETEETPEETPAEIQWQAHAVITYPYHAYRMGQSSKEGRGYRPPPTTTYDDVTVTAATEHEGRIRAMQVFRQRHPDGRVRMTSFHRVGA